MTPQNSFTSPERILLSAGPRAGKTALLEARARTVAAPCRFMALTPDDGIPAYFFRRLLQPWPHLRVRLEELSREFPQVSQGGQIALLLTEALPDLCLFLDDVHTIEGTALEAELEALARAFPDGGTLLFASRHRHPRLERHGLTVWPAELESWNVAPAAEDLEELPAALLEQLLALNVVQEVEQLPDADELVRRNLAVRTADGMLAPMPAWHEALDRALLSPVPEAVWEHVAQGFTNSRERRNRPARDQQASRRILARVPERVRLRYPVFQRLEGAMHLEAGNLEVGWGHFERALSASANDPAECYDLMLEMASYSTLFHDMTRYDRYMGELAASQVPPTPRQQTRLLNLRAWEACVKAPTAEHCDLLQQVLAIPPDGDRAIHYEHYLAATSLHIDYFHQGNQFEAVRYAERSMAITTQQGFDRNLLDAYTARLRCDFMTPFVTPPLTRLLEVPDQAFATPTPDVSLAYLALYGIRALRVHALDAARGYFNVVKTRALKHGLNPYAQMCSLYLLDIACHQGRFEEARLLYDEVSRHPLEADQQHFVILTLATALAQQGHPSEAKAMLRSARPALRWHQEQVALVLRKLDGELLDAQLESPLLLGPAEFNVLWQWRYYWVASLGLSQQDDTIACHALGELRLVRNGEGRLQVSRQKAMELLAHLLMAPRGLASETLAERMYEGALQLEALHTGAYSLRQGLKKLGASDILESSGGHYRIRWSQVSFCDLYEFDALFQRASELEAAGHVRGATLFFELALVFDGQPPFETMGADFEPARTAFAGKVRHARRFVELHDGTPFDA